MEDIAWGLLALRSARALNLAATLSQFGTLTYALLIWQRAAAAETDRLPRLLGRLLRWGFWISGGTAILFLLLQAVRMTEPATASETLEGVLQVALASTFGHALLARTALAGLAALVAGSLAQRGRLIAACGLGGAALALQAWLGHAAAAETPWLPLALVLHLLAAGAWLGGIVPLALTLRIASASSAIRCVRRFSWLGLACVALLILTAAVQGMLLIGGPGGWFGTAYGWTAIAKSAGFLGLLALAAINRALLTPRLDRSWGKRALVLSIGIETVLGLAVTVAAAALATLPPGLHEQPVWPFPQRPDFSVLGEPYVRRELSRALLLGGLLAFGVLSLFWRRTRLVGPLAVAVILWLWAPQPNLRVLFVPAVPTTYQTTLTGYTPAAIARGAERVRALCSEACFRAKDDPSDLTPYGLWRRSDGDLFWWLTAVFDRIGHSPFPYGTIAGLDDTARWQLIDYFRARVAGRAARTRGIWTEPMPPPDLEIHCGGETRRLSDLRGSVVRIVALAQGTAALPRPTLPGTSVTTVLLTRNDPEPEEAAAGAATCRAGSPDAWTAFSLVSGTSETELSSYEILLDANGWLRTRFRPPQTADARETEACWRDEVLRLARAPYEAGALTGHRH